MAEKRMFTQKIIDSDAFLEMPLSAQALYFHLNMRADDDGFVNNPKRVTKLVSASEDDLKILLMKRFIIGFASGVIVIKHWRMHNTLKSDRYHPTDYQEEFAQLGIKPNKAYTDHPERQLPPDPPSVPDSPPMEPERNQDGTNLEPEIREDLGLDKGSDKEEIKEEDTACAEQPETVVTTLLLNDGTEYGISDKYIDQMQQLFPNVNVWQQMLKMSAWCINNPRKRKTRRGITAFINSWLSREQDRGAPAGYQPQQQGSRNKTADSLHESYNMMAGWAAKEGGGD